MLKQSRICLAVISAGLLITTDLRAQTPSLTIVPNRITNDYLGPITLLISNITPGMAVAVSKYPDFNNNGVIDPFEPMVARWKVTDAGQPGIGGVRNSNVPGDEDGTTNGRIRMVLNFPSDNLVIEKVAGHYLFELSDPQGSFTAVTAPFEVVQRAWPQSVSGQALDSVSGAPFTNAYVVMVNGNDVGGTGTMTDANGNYAVSNAPDGYVLLAVRPGYVSDQGAAQVSLGATSNLIVNLASSPGSYSISGQVTDQNNGKPIAGLFVQCKNSGNLMSMAFTDTNGNYTLAANPGQWKVSLKQDSGFLSKGYVASGSDASLVVSNASVTGINFSFPKATTLICGLVLDNNSNSLPGIIIDGQDSSYNSAARCLSRADGSYCLGLLSGTWTPQASDGTLLASLGLISQFTPSITLTNGQAAYQNIILTHVSTHLKGVVVDNLG